MPFCPQCGSPNAVEAAFCGVCGHAIPKQPPAAAAPLATAPAPTEAPRNTKHTLLGVVSPFAIPAPPAPIAAPPAQAPAPTAGAAPAKGAAAPAPVGPAPGAAPPARAGLQQTMLGIAPFSAPVPAPAPACPPATSGPSAPAAATPARARSGAATMLGMVAPPAPLPPVPAPAPQRASQPALGTKRTLLGFSVPAGLTQTPAKSVPRGKGQTLVGFHAPAPPPGKRTLLGIALPAFAPAPPAEPEYVEETYDEIVPETGAVERRVRRVARPPPPVYARPAFWVLAGAAALLACGLGIVFLVRSPPPLSGQPRVDAGGRDLLHVTCASCPDGTKITLVGAQGVVSHGEADVALAKPLAIGRNKLSLTVERPAGRSETVPLDVPVAYRIWPELASLEDPVPAVRVMVEAQVGSAVTVQGKPVTLGEGGRGVVKIDVRDQLLGLARDERSLERDIPYTIATEGSAPESGKLTVRVGVAPLAIESPGPRMVTDQATFMLAGRTAKGGGLLVAGRPIAVGPEGAFAQLMNISSIGATEVELRASAPPLAPRLSKLTVKRVASLAAEAKDEGAKATSSYADVLSRGDAAIGTTIAWKGEIVQASTQGHQAIAIVEVGSGCPKRPCRARVVSPGAAALAAGEKLSVYGRVAGFVSLGDERLPDVEADFVVKGP